MNFSILGALAVTEDERSLPLGGPKQRAVLAILLLNANEPVSRDRLVDGVWGERPPAKPAQALDTYVSRLRKVLGPERIDRGGGGYVLRVHRGELDVDRFEAFAAAGKFSEALAVWRGPALSDLLFEPFAQHAADELEERRVAVTEEAIDAALAAGAAGAVVPRLEQLVREHPWRERLLGQLMVALYQDGRQERALDAYRQAKQNLARELGLEPSPRLSELERQILAHDPALGRPPRAEPPRRTRLFRYVVAAAAAAAIATVIAVVLRSTRSDAVTLPPASATRLVAFDASSRRIEVASTPADAPTALAPGFGSLWVADPNGGQILRIDRRSGSVTDRIAVPGQPSSLAVGAGALWVASAVGGFVTRIDPGTDRPTRVRRLGGANSSALLFVDHMLWVADQADHSLVEMDPRTGSILHTITLDLAPTGLAAGRGQIWAAGYTAGAVDQVDLVSHQVVARLPVGQGPSAIVAGGGSIWVANGLDGTLTRIDSATGRVLSSAPVGSCPAALAVTGNSVWVASEYSGEVVQVDARTGVMRSVVRSGGRPTTLTADGMRVWVGGAPATSLHRGGTLTLSGTTPPNSLDPAFELSGSWEPTQLTRLVHDTLVTFANAPGATGLRLVPDLAVALPQPTDRGRTYVFHIRPGIRYSTGRVVRASDFRRAFVRLFRAESPGTGFYTSIIGAGACQDGRARCDLSKGVVADDADRTVTFHLTAPDPVFLFKLTEFAFGAPVPPDVPERDLGYAGVPGTGPYRIAAAGPNNIRLERNPYFREWSHAAQPDGNPDRIIWTFPASHDVEIRAIEQGRADWTLDFIPVDQLDRIRTAHPGQLHVNPAFIVEYIPLNPNLPPFDSIKVRRALNLAVDRRKIARLYGGSIVGTPLCQALPPGMPGFVRYCPYTRAPDRRGSYAGPDLRRARQLVRASGRARARVVVRGVSNATAIPPGEPAYIARVLRTLGFKATVRLADSRTLSDTVRRNYQLSVDGDWLPDFPNAASFLPPFFGCHGSHNIGYYCNRRLDRLMQRATQADADNAVGAAQLWAEADRLITDQAYWVPTISLNEVDFVSSRLHNYVYSPVWGFLADQAWVR